MARKPIHTKDTLIKAAILLIRNDGIDALNARNLAKWAGCSTAPIFHVFENMEQLCEATKEELDNIYDGFMEARMDDSNRLLSQSIAYIEFARNEPYIFAALFMNERHKGMEINDIAHARWNQKTIENIMSVCKKESEQARQLFLKVWLFSHGIAAQMITGGVVFSPETIEALVEEAFILFAGTKGDK